MPQYKAATAAPVHLKIVVSFLLSILVAVTVGLALRSVLRVDTVIDKHAARYRTRDPKVYVRRATIPARADRP